MGGGVGRSAVGLISYSANYPALLARRSSLQVMAQRPTGQLKTDHQLALQNFKSELSRLKRFAAFKPQLDFDHSLGAIARERLKLVIGSDWVWYFDQNTKPNPIYYADLPQFNGVRRYAYAASFGTARPEHSSYRDYAAYQHEQWAKFRAITLREPTWLPEFERLKLNLPLGPVSQVLDPALLLDRNDYAAMVAQPPCAEPYVLIYTLPYPHQAEDVHALLDVLTAYVYQCGQKPKIIDISWYHVLKQTQYANRIKALGLEYEYRYDTGPDDFVNWVAHAGLVLTPSFHGMVYSLIFGTPFSYFFLRGPDPRVTTLEQVFEIAPLKIVPGQHFDLAAFQQAYTQCQQAFSTRIADLRRHSYQVLNAIVQD